VDRVGRLVLSAYGPVGAESYVPIRNSGSNELVARIYPLETAEREPPWTCGIHGQPNGREVAITGKLHCSADWSRLCEITRGPTATAATMACWHPTSDCNNPARKAVGTASSEDPRGNQRGRWAPTGANERAGGFCANPRAAPREDPRPGKKGSAGQ